MKTSPYEAYPRFVLSVYSKNGEIRHWYKIINSLYLSIKSHIVGICSRRHYEVIITNTQNAQFYEE